MCNLFLSELLAYILRTLASVEFNDGDGMIHVYITHARPYPQVMAVTQPKVKRSPSMARTI